MTRRTRVMVSGVCAVAAALLCLAYGQHVERRAEQARAEALERYGGEVVSLVVATEAIEAGEVIDQANAAERDWIAELAPLDAVMSLDEVLGSEVSVPVAAGVPLTSLNFRDAEGAVEVPADRVAVSMGVSGDLGLPAGLAAGDVLAAYAVSADGVRLISGDVQVLGTSQASSGLLSAGTLTVAVLPDDVAEVLAASGNGSLRLALPGDEALGIVSEAPAAPSEVSADDADGGEDDEDVDEGSAPEVGAVPSEGSDAA